LKQSRWTIAILDLATWRLFAFFLIHIQLVDNIIYCRDG
jgi:hypothetical protein